ncbi:hypothetical protein HAX54_041769 [Datura stramonium]|uniref:Uncharacterized protein n=1 Tax=Datura stramonium TaxID=4076 RepID=A0ABS8W0I9_DATST|nr:hypothetical protein [Datura stramonium]
MLSAGSSKTRAREENANAYGDPRFQEFHLRLSQIACDNRKNKSAAPKTPSYVGLKGSDPGVKEFQNKSSIAVRKLLSNEDEYSNKCKRKYGTLFLEAKSFVFPKMLEKLRIQSLLLHAEIQNPLNDERKSKLPAYQYLSPFRAASSFVVDKEDFKCRQIMEITNMDSFVFLEHVVKKKCSRMKTRRSGTCHPTGPSDKLGVLLPHELLAGISSSYKRILVEAAQEAHGQSTRTTLTGTCTQRNK